jgi:ubiquinone/menaquinone biosynthesis C-methylase UbiE
MSVSVSCKFEFNESDVEYSDEGDECSGTTCDGCGGDCSARSWFVEETDEDYCDVCHSEKGKGDILQLDGLTFGNAAEGGSGSSGEDDLQEQFGETDESRAKDNETLESEFWDKTFQGIDPDDPVEWLLSYNSVGRFFRPYKRDSGRTLCIGCGNSDFSAGLDADGFQGLTSTDFSPVVIKQMQKKYKALKWEVQDARKLTYTNASFDVLVDKSLLDCMFYAEDRLTALSAMLNEIHRVLKPGGVALFLTVRAPGEVNQLFDGSNSKQLGWKQLSMLNLVAESDGEGQVNKHSRTVAKCLKRDIFDSKQPTCELYFYVCQKLDSGSKSTGQKTLQESQRFKQFSRKEMKELGLDTLPEEEEEERKEQEQEKTGKQKGKGKRKQPAGNTRPAPAPAPTATGKRATSRQRHKH